MMENSIAKTTASFLLGLALGAGVVALAGTGRSKEVQEKVKDTLRKTSKQARETADDLGNELEEAMQTTRDRFGSTKIQDEKGLQTG